MDEARFLGTAKDKIEWRRYRVFLSCRLCLFLCSGILSPTAGSGDEETRQDYNSRNSAGFGSIWKYIWYGNRWCLVDW
jgi:hypothetical protein